MFKQAMTNHNSRMNNVLAKHTTKVCPGRVRVVQGEGCAGRHWAKMNP